MQHAQCTHVSSMPNIHTLLKRHCVQSLAHAKPASANRVQPTVPLLHPPHLSPLWTGVPRNRIPRARGFSVSALQGVYGERRQRVTSASGRSSVSLLRCQDGQSRHVLLAVFPDCGVFSVSRFTGFNCRRIEQIINTCSQSSQVALNANV